jgi:uncharacterized protein (TIGR02266 family)
MRNVSLDLGGGEEFLKIFLSDLPGGGVFVATEESFEVGEPVSLDIRFPEIPEGVRLTGVVEWRRAPVRWRSALQPGVGISLGEKERSRVEFLLDFCRGDLSRIRKPGRRVPVDIRVDIHAGPRKSVGRSRDLSRGGVFVVTDLDLERMEAIELDMFLPGSDEPERFMGTVAWCRAGGSEPGVGIRFESLSPLRRRRIANLVSEIEGRLASASGVTALGTVRA